MRLLRRAEPAISGGWAMMRTSFCGSQPCAATARSSMPWAVEAKGTEMVLPLSSASDCTGDDAGTTMPLPLPRVLPESTLMNRLCLPASRWATPLKEPGKSAMAPKSSLPATISLVSGAPLVKFFHSIW
ncbi:hypothetical protein D3C84_444330 [compost metagenome]